MNRNSTPQRDATSIALSAIALAAAALGAAFTPAAARADVVTDWSLKAEQVVVESKIGTPPAVRVLAIVHSAVNDAVQTARQPGGAASVDAAVAAAHRGTLLALLPAQSALIESTYQAALATIPDSASRAAGLKMGEAAAAAVIAKRSAEGPILAVDTYRPFAVAGHYVPTAMPAAPQWVNRHPWLMKSPKQFRPAPPPALNSEAWARDLNEVRNFGGKVSAYRTQEQTDVAKFWEYSLPPIYHGLVRSVAQAPGRDVQRNAKLFAAVAQAMDDALISVFDAKYHYNFWRPVTAIRNADIDGNDATAVDPGWSSFIDTPLHPEYPSAHASLAAAVGTVLQADAGKDPLPTLTTTSPTAKGAARHYASVDALVREVADARVWDGVHYRQSSMIGAEIGRAVGGLAAKRYYPASHASVDTRY